MKQYEYVAQQFGCDIRDIVAMKNVSFPDIDIQNFMVAMHLAKSYDLDPRAKEIWGWQKAGKITIVASNAGFLKIARKQPGFLGIISNAVFPGDDFEMDMATGTVTKHIIHPEKMEKDSVPLGAYAILRMEGKDPATKWVYWNEYVQNNDYTPWKKQKSAMICKCATSVMCREAFGLSGLYGEEEMEQETTQQKASKAKAALAKVVESEGAEIETEISENVTGGMENISKIDDWLSSPESRKNEVVRTSIARRYDEGNYTEEMAKKDLLIISQIA